MHDTEEKTVSEQMSTIFLTFDHAIVLPIRKPKLYLFVLGFLLILAIT